MNQELLDICNHFSIENSIVTMAKGSSLVAIKDQNEYFPSILKCRLVIPAKSDLGKVNKVVLGKINNKIRGKLNVNQWKNLQCP